MKKLLILLFCITIANKIQAASFGREYDGYNYDKPSINLELTAPNQEQIQEEAAQDTEPILEEQQTHEEASVAVENEVPTEIIENSVQPAETAENYDSNSETSLQEEVEAVAHVAAIENEKEAEVPLDLRLENQPIAEVNEQQIIENAGTHEVEQQNQEVPVENIESEAPILSNDEVEEAPQSVQEPQEVEASVEPSEPSDPQQAIAVEASEKEQSNDLDEPPQSVQEPQEVEASAEPSELSKPSEPSEPQQVIAGEASETEQSNDLDEAPQSVQEPQAVEASVEPSEPSDPSERSEPQQAIADEASEIEQSNDVENVNHELSGYNYENPEKAFTQPPPLAEQLAVEENFIHQELASAHKPHRHGAVKRVKLRDPAISENIISSCGDDWKANVVRRHQSRPKNRRLAPYTEQLTGIEYFVGYT